MYRQWQRASLYSFGYRWARFLKQSLAGVREPLFAISQNSSPRNYPTSSSWLTLMAPPHYSKVILDIHMCAPQLCTIFMMASQRDA